MTNSQILKNRVALITGASRGIGAEVAKAYAKAGAHVILLARTVGGLEETDDAIRAEGGEATLMPLDLSKLEDLERLGPTLHERFGKLDIFVANAGALGTLKPLAHNKLKEWQSVMDVNVTANFQMLRSLDPLLRTSDAGRAIFVTSGVARKDDRAYWGAYKVSKAALEALAHSYAAETKKTNVRVNIIDPGRVRTAMRASAYPGEDPETLPTADILNPLFLDLANPACTKHGEIVEAKSISS